MFDWDNTVNCSNEYKIMMKTKNSKEYGLKNFHIF